MEELLDTGSDEKVTVFTDNKALIELATQINRMLEDRQKVKVEYRRTEMASKKMLSNISHDIKTPMTVILGYLEIMRLNGAQSNEMLQKIESTAHRVMGLITQFFTLAKLEAGDTDMPLERLNVNEACRENILDFYELLSQKDFQVELDIPEGSVTLVQLYAKKIPTISFALFIRISLITDRHNVRLSSWDNLSYKALKSDCNNRSAALKSGAVSCTGSVS